MSKLSDEKIDEIAKDYKAILLGGNPYFPWFDYAKAIEDAVLEAQGKQKQEPLPFSADRVTYHKAAPVVQPDMVLVPREPTEAMLDAAMNRYQHVSPEAKARYTQMHRENFRCDYRAMIAACEDKS